MRHIGLNKILEIVAEVTKVPEFGILSRNRKYEFVQARAIYYKVAREQTKYSLGSIGATVYRDHSTVIHNLRVIEADIDTNYRNAKTFAEKAEKRVIKWKSKKKKKRAKIKIDNYNPFEHSKINNYETRERTNKSLQEICSLLGIATLS